VFNPEFFGKQFVHFCSCPRSVFGENIDEPSLLLRGQFRRPTAAEIWHRSFDTVIIPCVNPIVACRGAISDFADCFWYFVTVVEMLYEVESIINSRVCFLSTLIIS
jgi:hypothetical protein